MKRLLTALTLLLVALGIAAPIVVAQEQNDRTLTRERERQMAFLQLDLPSLGDDATRDALLWLYRSMPLPDVSNYPLDFYRREVETTLRARREMPWGARVPEREWRHFVLPLRVNNEALDAFRSTCYTVLKERVRGLTMEEAVLEVNRWCHEHATYKPSDARTASPLSTMRTATGRCGEESTFTVAALRAVGIPARQVYTPRWAHTDDNHAWVEAWVDGRWRFLGACEPEPVLDLGWFNAPASRGMLMHTRVFGRYDGPEDRMVETPTFTEINVTANYAQTVRSSVRVVDHRGRAVKGARLEFKVYNYAEFYTVFATTTDAQGRAAITTGRGDLLAWAAHGGRFGFAKLTPGAHDVPLQLRYRAGERFSVEMDITPPAGHNNLPIVHPADAERNNRLKAYEDSLRTAYVATFPTEQHTRDFCAQQGYDYAAVRPLIEKSRGNAAALYHILAHYRGRAILPLLEALTEKDLTDLDPTILYAHYGSDGLPTAMTPFEACYRYSPRVATEPLSPWGEALRQRFSPAEKAAFIARPQTIVDYIRRHTQVADHWNANRLWQTPMGILRAGYTDARSQGLLFVAIARSLGIAARIDEVTSKVQWADAGEQWHDVLWQKAAQPVPQGRLQLAYSPTAGQENPSYYTHFTLSRLDEGMPQLLNFPEGDTWASRLSQPTALDAGHYILVSGTRLADGGVLAQIEGFPVPALQTTTAPLRLRHDEERVEVIGSFDAEQLYLDPTTHTRQSILSLTGRGYYLLALVRPNHEPTNHILHDLSRQRQAIEAWGRPLLLLFESVADYERFAQNRGEFTQLPANLHFAVAPDAAIATALAAAGLDKGGDRPLVIVADTFNRVVFRSQGYTIGLGDQLVNLLRKINP